MNNDEDIEVLEPLKKEEVVSIEKDSSLENNVKTNNNDNKKNPLNNKLIIIIGCSVIGLILFVVLLIFLFTSGKTISQIYNPDSPILINENGKYGYIDSKGKILIKPKYDFAYPFYGKYAFVVINDKEEKYNIIDKKGNVKVNVSSQYDCTYISEYNVWVIDKKLYNENLKQISKYGVEVSYKNDGYFEWKNEKDNTAGIMDYNGKITYKYKFKKNTILFSLEVSSNYDLLEDNYCSVNIDNKKRAIVNCETGKVIYDYGNHYISASNYNVFTIRDSKTFKFISTLYVGNNKVLYKSTDKNIELKYCSKDYLRIQDSSKSYDKRFMYYNLNTKKVENKKPDIQEIDSLNTWQRNNNISEVTCDKGVGLKKKDKELLACEWSDIDYFDTLLYDYLESKGRGYIVGEKDNKTYLISTKNFEKVLEFDSNNVHYNSLSTFIYYVDNSTKKQVIYNLLSGKKVSIDKDAIIKIGNNYSTVTKGSKVDYYNTNLELIYTINKK